MNNAIKKAFTASVVATTIAWSIGLSAIPFAAKAAPASGSLVKASLPAVYYVGADGKRYVFPNEKTYKTWYSDFSSVQTITDAELAALPIGGNVTYKPGVRMVKITTDPKVYAVAANGTLRWVSTQAVAEALYGSSWNQMIDDVPDAFFTNYSIGADITSASDYDPSAQSSTAASINADKGLAAGADGSLAVMASSPGAVGGTVPLNAMGVTMLKFDVKNNGSSALTLDSATVLRTGLGQVNDFNALYLYDGESRLTTGRSLNSSTHEATFGGLNLSIDPGAMKHLKVVADYNGAGTATVGDVNSLSLVDLTASGVSASGVPLSGPNFTIAGASVGGVTVTRSGSQPLSNVRLGGTMQKIGEFQLTAGAAEDVHLHKIALFNGGAVSRSDVSNLVLKQAGNTLATAAGYDDTDRATFVLASPFAIEKGASRIFMVYADIASDARAGATETLLTYLDQPTDLYAVGATYGYGVTVDTGTAGTYDGTGCALGAGNCSSTRVEGGQLTLTYNGPASADVAVNGKDVELFNFTMAAQSNLEVRNLRMQIAAGNVAGVTDGLIDTTVGAVRANYTDIKVVDTATGAIVAGPLSLATGGSDTTQALTYTSTFMLSAGQARTLKVTADVANNSAANFGGDTVNVNLLPFVANDIRNLDNSTYIALTDIVPNSGTTGNAMTVQQPSLTVSASSTPVAQTYIQGAQGVAAYGVNLKAGDASDININSLSLTGRVDANDGLGVCTVAPDGTFAIGQDDAACNSLAAIVSTAKLMDGSTQLGDTESPSTSTGVGTGGVMTFDNLDLTIPKGGSKNLVLMVNLSGGQTAANMPDDFRFEVNVAGDISATDGDGNNVTATAAGWPVAGNVMRMAASGSLVFAVAPDDTESEAGLVIGDSSNVVLAKYKMTAVDEALKLTKAQFNVATPAGVTSLSLYDGSTLVGGPVSLDGAGMATFSNLSFEIPKDGSNVLAVKGNLNSVGASGAGSGSAVTVQLDPTAGTFEVRGMSAGSSTLLTDANGSTVAASGFTLTSGGATPIVAVPANAKLLRKSKPTVSLVSLPSSLLTTGDVIVMRFTVAADAAGDVAFKALEANLTSSSTAALTVSAPNLRRVGDGTDLGATNAASGTCNAAANTCALNIMLTNEEVISAGSARTYDLRINLAGTLNTGDSMSTNLVGDAAQTTGVITNAGSIVSVGGTPYNFVWSDISAVPHSDVLGGPSSADWTSGLYVDVLPTDTQTLSK